MKPIRIFLGLNALLLLLLLGAACATSTQSAAKVQDNLTPPDPANIASTSTPSTDHAQEDNVPRTKAVDAVRLVKEGSVILVDVRDSDSYKTMHAKGAIHVSYQDIQNGKLEKLPRDKTLIFYCT